MPRQTPGSASNTEREQLIEGLLQIQRDMETSTLPHAVEPLLNTALTIQQLKVLLILVTELEDNTVQGLATLLEVSLATMSGILDRLAGHGMVTRTTDPGDQRVRRLHATPQGRAAIRSILLAQTQMHREPLERLTTDELRGLSTGLFAYLREAAEAPEAAASA